MTEGLNLGSRMSARNWSRELSWTAEELADARREAEELYERFRDVLEPDQVAPTGDR